MMFSHPKQTCIMRITCILHWCHFNPYILACMIKKNANPNRQFFLRAKTIKDWSNISLVSDVPLSCPPPCHCSPLSPGICPGWSTCMPFVTSPQASLLSLQRPVQQSMLGFFSSRKNKPTVIPMIYYNTGHLCPVPKMSWLFMSS